MAVPVNLAWLWDNADWADTAVHIYPAGDGSDSISPASQQPLQTLHLHAIVLASVSPSHFRGQLARWSRTNSVTAAPEPHTIPAGSTGGHDTPMDTADQHSAAPVAATQCSANNPAPVVPVAGATRNVLSVQCYPSEPVTVPETVLRHAYTGQLPDDPTMLIWMAWRADYLDLGITATACLTQLQHLADAKKLSASDTILLAKLPDFQTADVKASVTQIISTVLPQHFSDSYQIATTPELLELFIQMPFSMLLQWAGLLSQLTVDHENTLVLLYTAWHDSQQPAPGQEQTDKLSELVQLDQLTVSFHIRVMDRLRWYRPVGKVVQDHAVLHALGELFPNDKQFPPSRLCVTGVAASGRQPSPQVQRKLAVPREGVAAIWEQKGVPWRLPQTVYFAGVNITVELYVAPIGLSGSWQLRVQTGAEWPEALKSHGLDKQVNHPVMGMNCGYQVASGTWPVATVGSIYGSSHCNMARWSPLGAPVSSEQQLHDLLKDGVLVTLCNPK